MSPWVVILFLVTSDLFVAQLGINQDGSIFLHHLDNPSEEGDCDATNKKYVGNFVISQAKSRNTLIITDEKIDLLFFTDVVC